MAVAKEIAEDGLDRSLETAQPRPQRALGARLQNALVALYVVVGLLLLVPGVLARWQPFDVSGDAGVILQSLAHELQPIAFGHTLRFWLGVTGATMLALLVLYPILKLFGARGLINIARLFHVHTILGVAGPVLILYHCNFGTGSTPANVALAATLVIAVSGVFGHFAYRRTSASFYDCKREAGRLRDVIAEEAQALKHSSSRAGFLDDLAAYDRHALPDRSTPRRARPTSRDLDERRHQLVARAGWMVENQGPQEGWDASRCHDTGLRLGRLLEDYFRLMALAARRARADRLASYWRLLHLPIFLVLLIAAGMHVSRVWNVDGATATYTSDTAAETPAFLQPRRDPTPGAGASPIATRSVATRVEGPAVGTMPRPLPAARDAQQTARLAGSVAASRLSVRVVRLPQNGANVSTGGAPASRSEAKAADPVEQLLRASDRASPSEPLDPDAIRARLAELKKDPAFDHARNRFKLVGKHREVACEKCHTTTLSETTQTCLGCHREDDVHRGRRPQCESCHTPVDWNKIKRR
ncbi:MAG: hypothetical protein JSS20_12015 [Proteobacteria bacterium]|nr:hypothetical protein [Pseudomonadota bacterium]